MSYLYFKLSTLVYVLKMNLKAQKFDCLVKPARRLWKLSKKATVSRSKIIETGERKSERSFYVSDEVNVSVGKLGHAAVRNSHENFNDSQQRHLLCLHCPL